MKFIDDDEAIRFLAANGYTISNKIIWHDHKGYFQVSDNEKDALNFLVKKYGYDIEKIWRQV